MSARNRNRKGLQDGQLIGAANPAAISNVLRTGPNELTVTWSPELFGEGDNFQIAYVGWNGGMFTGAVSGAPTSPGSKIVDLGSINSADVLMAWLNEPGGMRTTQGARINSIPVIAS